MTINNFNRQQAAGINIEYLFYIEGILVPIQSFSVNIGLNEPASMTADIAPFPEAVTCLRKGMKVFLFKRVNGEVRPTLRFSGYIVGRAYGKSYGQRSLRIECASFNYRWSTMLFHVLDTRYITGTDTLIFPSFDENKALAVIDDPNASENEKAAARTQIARAKTQKDPSYTTITNAGADVSIYVPGYVESNDFLEQQIGDGNIGVDANRSYNTSMRGAVAGSAEGGSKPANVDKNIQSAFLNILKKKADYMEAFFILIKYAYLKSDPYSKKEFEDLKLEEFTKKLDIFDSSVNVSDVDGKNQNSVLTFSYYVKKAIMTALSQSSAGAPFIHAIIQALDSLFIKFAVDPLALQNSVLFFPMSLSFIPPKCNVIFPNMYNEINFSQNLWQEPTRSFTTFTPGIMPEGQIADANIEQNPNLAQVRGVLSDTADEFIRKARIETKIFETGGDSGQIAASELKAALDKRKTVMDILTKEEQEVGITLNPTTMPFDFMTTLGTKAIIQMADFVHSIARLAVRSCTIRGCIVDDLVVGLPILVLDGLYSIQGILASLSYSVSADGDYMCTLQILYPKWVFLGDQTLASPAFLGTDKKASVENIGTAYQDAFGCGSVAEGVDLSGVSSDTGKLAKITETLINKFCEESERWKYVEDYRKRKEWTIDNVFKDFYGCTASGPDSVKDDGRVLEWTGGIFKPYKITEYQSAATQKEVGSMNVTINKQEYVRNYLNKFYTNSAGVTAGIVTEDAELDSSGKIKVSITEE